MAQDQPITKALGEVTADLLKQIGFNVDFVATDWGTTGTAPRQEDAARPGRLEHVPHLARGRRLHQSGRLRGDPGQRREGVVRLADAIVEEDIVEWFDAKNLDEEKAAMEA